MSKRAALGILLLSFIIPFGVLIYLSVSTQWYYPSLVSHPFTLSNWTSFFDGRTGLLESTSLSLFISLMVSIIATIGWIFYKSVELFTTQQIAGGWFQPIFPM